MKSQILLLRGWILALFFLSALSTFGQQKSPEAFSPEAIQFFEMEVRPLLHTHCMGCRVVNPFWQGVTGGP